MSTEATEELEESESENPDDSDDGDTSKNSKEEPTEALDELEAEELEMLTEDETNEAIVIDEAAEMRAIRRAEIAMEAGEVDEAASDEFVCTVCFLVKRRNQLAGKRKKVCLDCAS
jgi:hypothetical protein